MKIPFSWLRDYVRIELSPRDLAERLTFAGLEVEELEKVEAAFQGVVVGEIKEIQAHPHADKLLLCTVFDGQADGKVVCGAHNFKVGDKVAHARPGAILANGQAIGQAVIRGEKSWGMLCAEDELGLSDDHSGLLVLSCDTPAGAALDEVLGLPDIILHIEVTPNRPDCLSMIGVAREVAALTGKKLRIPAIDYSESGLPIEQYTRVDVEDGEGCPRYSARVLTNVTIKPSPFWARRRLALAGIRPINNIVDATNYVMLECGQPLHAFDHALLAEGRIVVRRARAGEKMDTLDGTQRRLTPEMLVIADARQAVAVAGVMGGANSGVLESTRVILLESAHFKPGQVRRASKKLGLSTESSHRFERGTDFDGVEWASRRAAALMAQWSDARIARGALDIRTPRPEVRLVRCRFERVRQVLGIDIENSAITAIFEKLELPVARCDQQECIVQPPSFRLDLEQEVDLIEEVARMHGLENIPARAPSRGTSLADDRPARAKARCREVLACLGLTEIMNYSFVSEAWLDRFETAATHRMLLPHPMSAEHAVLRPWLLPQMLETLGRNRSRQIAEAAFFEVGRVFFKDTHGDLREEERLAIGLMGAVGRDGLSKQRAIQEEEMFAWLKGMLESLSGALGFARGERDARGATDIRFVGVDAQRDSRWNLLARAFKKGRMATIHLAGAECGIAGLVGDEQRLEHRIFEPLAMLEIQLSPLLSRLDNVPVAVPLPAFPAVTRDMALRVGREMEHGRIEAAIWECAPKELTRVQLFDIYIGKELGQNCKSMAYSLTYQAPERTLTDAEVNELHAKVKAGLKAELNVEIREGQPGRA